MMNIPEDEQALFRHLVRVKGIAGEIDIVLTNTNVLFITANPSDVISLPWATITEVMYSPAHDPKGRVMVRLKTVVPGSEEVLVSLVGPTKEQNFAQQETMRKIITSIRKTTGKAMLAQKPSGCEIEVNHVSTIPPRMAGSQRYVGRIGRVKIEESYVCVTVQAYDSVTLEYEVTLLHEPEAGTKRMKPLDVIFPTRPDFLDTCPNPPHFAIRDKLDMKNIPSGSIIDFGECTSDPVVDGEKLSIRGAYRFVGKRTERDNGNVTLTRLPYCIYIAAANESDIIEFENIRFEQGNNPDSYTIVCLRGTIVFIKCVIIGAVNGLKVGSGNAPVKVTFEKGTIFNNGGCGVTVEAKAKLTMVHVNILSKGVGVYVKDKGIYIADHCHATQNAFGLLTCGAESVSQLRYCTFTQQRHCGVLVNGGAILMEYCQIDNVTGCGIVICDLDNATKSSLNNCRVISCRCGVRLFGQTEHTSTRTLVFKCEIGHIPACTIGVFKFCNQRYRDNTIDFVNFSDEHSSVTVNGIRQPAGDQHKLQRIQDVNDIVLRLSIDEAKELSTALYSNWPIKVRRYMTRLDIQMRCPDDMRHLKVNCGSCTVLETANASVPMQKCGHCKQTYYCDKECQRDAWSVHKTECRMTNDWQRELYAMNLLDCRLCHRITSKIDATDCKWVKGLYFCENCVTNDYTAVLQCATNITV